MSNYIYLILILIGLPIFLAIYRLIPCRFQKTAILIGSLIFYTVYTNFNIESVCFLLASVIINFFLQFPIKNTNNIRLKKALICMTTVMNALPLCLVKVSELAFWRELGLRSVSITGISFYTFTVIALQLDLYRGTVEQRLDPKEYGLFLMAYPRLAMGPIARYKEAESSLCKLDNEQGLTSSGLEEGIKSFIIGLGMKLLIADQLAGIWTGICTSGTSGIVWTTAWLGALVYTFELYFDFWGYSLIAIGLGRMLGIYIPVNFNQPYLSKTVSEFWRRWHITLGTWFRDYIYIPLGGNRKGPVRMVINLAVVWLMTGLWHGFSLNFIIWGGLLGLVVILEKLTPLGKLAKTKVIGHIYILFLMPLSWMIFAGSNPEQTAAYIKCMFGIYPENALPAADQFIRYVSSEWYILLAAVLMMIPGTESLYRKIKDSKWMTFFYLLIFGFSLHVLYSSGSHPFMYGAF